MDWRLMRWRGRGGGEGGGGVGGVLLCKPRRKGWAIACGGKEGGCRTLGYKKLKMYLGLVSPLIEGAEAQNVGYK